MRSLVATVLALGIPISIGAFAACGAPTSFDHITGGRLPSDAATDIEVGPIDLVPDDSLEAPRPIAPLSASWINGSRPHFKWELGGIGTTGAQVVVCGDPKCTDDTKKKTFPAIGRELTAPEDLAPGMYGWYLLSTTASTVGRQKKSPIWTMRIRGGTGSGFPTGSFVDPNGDGIPDLLVSVAFTPGPGGPSSFPYGYVLFFGTKPDDPTALNTVLETDFDPTKPYAVVFPFSAGSPNSLVATTDVDGDGASDLVMSDFGPRPPATSSIPYFDLVQGARTPLGADFSGALSPPQLPSLDPLALPSITAPGDLDGDGHGDLLVSTKTSTFAVFGAKDGLLAFNLFEDLTRDPDPDAGALPPPTFPIPQAGLDYDNDGRADIVSTLYFSSGPPFALDRSTGSREDFGNVETKYAAGTPPTTPPTAYTSGDIDGDGKTDIVYVTTIATKPSICVFGGSEPPMAAAIACWTPDSAPAGFASSMVTADLDGDGKDEILVGSSAGVDVLTRPTPTALAAEHLAIDYGSSLTVILPGRPDKAVWAAMRPDGTSFALYRGKEQVRVVPAATFSGTITKFGIGIR